MREIDYRQGLPSPAQVAARVNPPVDPAKKMVFARGHRYELRALQDFAEESGIYTCQPWAIWSPENSGAQIIVIGKEPWAICTPDGMTCASSVWGGAEAKTSSEPQVWGRTQVIERWEDSFSSVVPAHYATQCYWSMEVTGQGVMDQGNDHLQGRCKCPCHLSITQAREEKISPLFAESEATMEIQWTRCQQDLVWVGT